MVLVVQGTPVVVLRARGRVIVVEVAAVFCVLRLGPAQQPPHKRGRSEAHRTTPAQCARITQRWTATWDTPSPIRHTDEGGRVEGGTVGTPLGVSVGIREGWSLPATCPTGCAQWDDMAGSGNTRDQSDVDAKWSSGSSPSSSCCARPQNDPGERPWCFCATLPAVEFAAEPFAGVCVNADGAPFSTVLNWDMPGVGACRAAAANCADAVAFVWEAGLSTCDIAGDGGRPMCPLVGALSGFGEGQAGDTAGRVVVGNGEPGWECYPRVRRAATVAPYTPGIPSMTPATTAPTQLQRYVEINDVGECSSGDRDLGEIVGATIQEKAANCYAKCVITPGCQFFE
eukprot:gene21465-biopygen119056